MKNECKYCTDTSILTFVNQHPDKELCANAKNDFGYEAKNISAAIFYRIRKKRKAFIQPQNNVNTNNTSLLPV